MFNEEEPIVAYEFMPIKPLGKSSEGQFINSAVAVALKSGALKIYDLYGNLLAESHVDSPIKSLAVSPHNEDMVAAVLTEDNKMHWFEYKLERRVNFHKDKYRDLQETQH